MTGFSLAGRHIVVTGAGRGLGRAMAEAVADAGAHVSLVARSEDQLRDVQQGILDGGGAASLYAADLSDLDTIPSLAAALESGRAVDGVVHAAGIQHRADAAEFPTDEIRRVLTVNLEAPLLLSRELGRAQLAAVRPASHVFIGSLGSSLAIPRAVAYAASKAGLLGVVRTLAAEWARHGVRANLVAPGYFHTELTADLLGNPEQHMRVLSRIPMGRLGDPAELGGAVVFLLSDASGYITGQHLAVDGGWLAS